MQERNEAAERCKMMLVFFPPTLMVKMTMCVPAALTLVSVRKYVSGPACYPSDSHPEWITLSPSCSLAERPVSCCTTDINTCECVSNYV